MAADTCRMGELAALLGASADIVRRVADAGRLRTRQTRTDHRSVAGAELARFPVANLETREADVVVARAKRNRFPGIVTRVSKDEVAARVGIHAGPHRVVSSMTREAVDVGPAPDQRAIAAVKATTVVVEPGTRRKNP